MSPKLKALLIVLLVMVMPVRGIAAVSAGICGALEHHGNAAASERAMAHEDHGAHSVGVASHDAAAADTDDGSSALNEHCSACAACGASATITGVTLLLAPDAPRGAVGIPEPDSPTGILLGGLDRPPLTLSV